MGARKTSPAADQISVMRVMPVLVIYFVPFRETRQRFSAEGVGEVGPSGRSDTMGVIPILARVGRGADIFRERL